ncbi:MAG: hypothetical protein ACREV5_22110 [Steroidobacter sp.]
MDDYTFLILAKLKADRRRLAREAREALATQPQPERPAPRNNESEYSLRAPPVRVLAWR